MEDHEGKMNKKAKIATHNEFKNGLKRLSVLIFTDEFRI